jgi:hypothetical protein
MSRKLIQISVFILLLSGLVLGLAIKDGAQARALQDSPNAKIEGMLLDKFATDGKADFIVDFSEKADLSAASSMDWVTRGRFVYDTLTATAARVQAQAKSTLEGMGYTTKTFYAGNQLYVFSGSLDAANAVAALPEVSSIRATRVWQVDPVTTASSALFTAGWPGALLAEKVETTVLAPTDLDWGIVDTKADQFWGAYGVEGAGILVANIDTGVDYTHVALADNFKCAANPSDPACWEDPTNNCPSDVPCDAWPGVWHGTHTMGTMVGSNNPDLLHQVGMSPDSQWIACLGCPNGGCPDINLNTCADWILAPGQNPDNRPNVVNNSWGGGGGNTFYLSQVEAWRAAGVFPAFSAGNNYSCNSLGSPGDYQESFGSAAHASNRVIAGFSSKGPSYFGDDPYTKPNISAPGVDVMSAMPGDGWQLMSGTSMASPHTAGAVALLWSCNPSLVGQIDQTFQILQDNTDAAPAGDCGAPADGEGNYTYGYGYLDIFQAGALWCGETGTIDGHVYNAVGGAPIEGATVHGVGEFGGGPTAMTDQNGYFTMDATVGSYDVTAKHPHFMAETMTGVVVVTDTVTTVDFNLTPRGWVYGTVTDFDNGTPLAGATVSSDDGQSTTTDDQGYYEIYLDPGTHTVTAVATDYAEESAQVDIVSGVGTQQDFALQAAVVFVPSPIDVSVPLGTVYSQPATILNRMPHPYDFEFKESNGGYNPENISIPAFTGEVEKNSAPSSTGRAPTDLSPKPSTNPMGVLAGPPGYGADANYANYYTWPDIEVPGTWNLIGAVPGTALFGGDFANSDYSVEYALDYYSNSLYAIDTTTAAMTLIGPAAPGNGEAWTGMSWAPDGTMYASGSTCSSSTLYTIDITTAQLTTVGPITNGACIIDIAVNADGDLYGVDIVADTLVKIDPATGAGTIIGSVGVDANYAQGLTFDQETGVLWWASWNWSVVGGELRVIDTATGASMPVGGFPGGAEVDAFALPTQTGGDVLWMTEDPLSGSVPADSELPVSINFDASPAAGVTQPGTYLATLTVSGTPKVKVPVSMFVEAPEDWGRLDGTVTGLGYCDQNPAVLEGATVEIVGAVTATLTTNDLGVYATWLPEGLYDVTVTATDHTSVTTQVEVIAQQNVTQDFDLRWLKPCMSETPLTMETTLGLGETDTQQLTLTNDGAGVATFEMSDAEKGYAPTADMQPLVPTGNPIVPVGSSSNAAVQPFQSRINDNSILLLTTTDVSQSVGRALTELGFGYDSIYVPPITGIDFAPYDIVMLAMDGGLPSYADVQALRTGVIDAGKKLVFFGGTCVQDFAIAVNDLIIQNDINNYCWQITSPPQWTITDPTHPLADGLPLNYNYAGYGAGYYSQRVTDPDTEQVAVNGENWPAFLRKSTDGDFIWYVDSPYSYYWSDANDFAFLKQLVNNVVTVTGGGDALWLSEDPTSGEVPPDGATQMVDVTFDAGMVSQPGTYIGVVNARTNDPVISKFTVNVTMTVSAPPDWGILSGTVTGLGYCDSDPAPLKGAQVAIAGGLTLKTDSNGHYALWLQEGSYDVTVTADEHTIGNATVQVFPGGEVTVQDFDLRWLRPCVSIDPSSFSAQLDLGQTETQQLTLTNSGAGDLNWKTMISNGEYQPLVVNDVLVVAWDTTAAASMEAALTSLGVTYDQVDTYTFDYMTVDQLLEYSMVFYAGIPFDVEQNLLIAYLDAGGRLYISDNDVGYSISGSIFYQTYLQAAYIADHGGEILLGEDLMSGITVDVTNDPYPDSFSVGPEAVEIFTWQGGGNAGGDAIERGDYKAIYTSFDFQFISSPDVAVAVVENVVGFLGGGEVTWLYTDPTEGTIPADSSAQVDVTFDAVGLTQPGTYTANLKVNTNDPVNPNSTLPATLLVNAPPNYGKLSGNVNSLGYCDANPVPLKGAEVCIEGAMCLETAADGSYLTWLPAGDYNVSVTAEGHTEGLATVTVYPGGEVTVQNFDLRVLQPCLSEVPISLETTLDLGGTATFPITLTNTGAFEATFEVSDREIGYSPSKVAHKAIEWNGVYSNNAQAFPTQPSKSSHMADADILLIQDSPAWGSPAIETILNDNSMAYDLINSSQIGGWDFSSYKMIIIPSVQGQTYYDAFNTNLAKFEEFVDGGGLMLMNIATQGEVIDLPFGGTSVFNGQDYNYIIDPTYPIFTGVANPYWGSWASHTTVSDLLAEDVVLVTTGDVPGGAPVMVERYMGGGLVVMGGQTFEFGWINGQDAGIILTNMIPWYYNNFQGGGDAVWLTEEPITGTVGSDGGTQVIMATFDAGMVTQPGTYEGEIRIKTNDPGNKKFTIPATLNVNGPPDWGQVEGTVTGLGYCDENPAPLEGATVTIGDLVLTTDETGHYSSWLPQGDATLVVAAEEHVGQTATVTIVAQEITVKDFDLRFITPCVSVSPTGLEVNILPGQHKLTNLHLVNGGAGGTDFVVSEIPSPPVGQSRPIVTSGIRTVTIGDNIFGTNPNVVTGPAHQAILPTHSPNETTITESVSQDIMSGNSVSCNAGGLITDNHYLRAFDLEAFDITADFAITSVDIGIELAQAGGGGVQPAEIRLYTLEGDFVWANLTLIASAPVQVADQQLTIINMPVEGVIPAGSILVVDFFTPNGQAAGNSLWVGSNNLGQTASTYLSAADCGVPEPTPTEDIGFPGMNLVMNVTGNVGSQDIPWLSEVPVTGTVDADSIFSIHVSFDSMTYTLGTYYGTLKVKTGDTQNPTILVPVTMNVVATTDTYLPFAKKP